MYSLATPLLPFLANILSYSSVLASPTKAASFSCDSAPLAHTLNGTYHGRYLPSFNQDLFLDVPFANAPRLDNPTPLNTTWSDTRDAFEYGPTCYGFGSNPLLNLTQSEDCLNLNIIRPASANASSNLPVLLWIYGGGWRQGASADPMWNLSYIVNASVYQDQPILAVSINYRLSFLGFPAGSEAADAGILNLGLKDQRIALQWVQENIAAFGGDRRKVTIWGESAGGESVADHLLAFGGKGGTDLFHQGILVSGFPTGDHPSLPTANQPGYDAIAAHANCTSSNNTLSCLRTAPLSSIYPFEDTIPAIGLPWTPVLDGTFLRRPATAEIAAGNVAKVPVLLGGNSDEGLFIASLVNLTIPDTATLTALLRSIFPTARNATIDQLTSLYPLGDPVPPYVLPADFPWCAAIATVNLNCGAQWRRFAAIVGDWFITSARRYLAREWARMGIPTYSFRFDTDPTALDPLRYWVGLGPGFALHGAELAYEFGLPPGFTTSVDFYPPVRNVPPHMEVSRAMVSKWVSFVYAGDPNAVEVEGVPEWPVYGVDEGGRNMVFNATVDATYNHVEIDDYRAKAVGFIIAHLDEMEYGVP